MVDPITAAIAYVGASIGGAAGATLIIYATEIAAFTAFAATVAGSSAMQRRAKAKARAAYNASLKDREITFRSAVAPRRVVYGRDRVGGVMVFAQSTGPKSEFLHVVIALAAHECDAIEEVWFGDELLPTPDASGWITSGPFGAGRPVRSSHFANVSAGGTITLPRAAARVTDITSASTESVDGAAFAGTHTPGSAIVSGLPPGQTLTVGFEYDDLAQRCRVRKFLGTAGQAADADLVAASGGKWTTAHKGTGICYLYLMLSYDQEMFSNFDLSRVTAVVRGKKVLDPRTGTTAWTDNSALITADWLRDQAYGMRASAAEVPSAEVIAAANICDELVTLNALGATQKRYTFNGSFTTDQAPRDVLEDMLSSMAGHCVWTQGRWLMRPGAYRTPPAGAEITVDHLAEGGVTVTPRASRSALFNAVRATYRDPSQGWVQVQAPLVQNATYTAQDGGVQVVRDITLPFAMDALRAQRLAKIELERSRQAVTVQAGTNLRAYDYAPTDTTLMILSRYGWGSGKVFEVIDRTWSPEGTLRYTWRETAAAVYAWNYGEATVVDAAPDTDLPSPYTRPAALAVPTLASGTAQLWKQADGTIISRAYASWTASANQFVREGGRIELQWAIGGSEDWQDLAPMPGDATEAWIAPVPDGEVLVVRIRQVNPLGVRSNWSYATVVVVGKTAAPANPSGFAATVSKGRVRWVWAEPQDVDYSNTEIRATNSGWGGAGALWVGRASEWLEVVTASGSLTRYIKHFDATGNQSASSAFASLTVTPTDLVQDGINGTNGTNGANGLSTALVHIYQRATSAPAVPTATATFTFSGASIAGLNNGWQATPPAGTSPLYVSVATASSSGATDTITSAEWASPVVLAANGADGLNAATVYLFQRTSSATAPSLPSATVTYTFLTGVASGVNNGWTQTLPTTGGAYRWVTTASALSSASTDTLASGEWAAASLLAQDGADGANGANGANGTNGAPAVSSSLTRLLAAFTADSTGLIDASQSFTTTMAVMLGTADDTSNWSISRTSSDASITTSISGATVTITGIGTSLETGTVTVTATRSGYPTQTIVVQVSKVKRAVPAAYPQAFAADVTNGIIINATANAYVRLNTNGTVETSLDNSSWTAAGNWYLPTTTGIGSSYRVANTLVGSALIAGDSPNYQSLSSAKTYQLSQSPGGPGTYNEKRAQLTIRIAASGNDAPLAVGYATLYAYVDRT